MGNIISIQKPERSECLAELTGILLGDGGITRYQVVITLNSQTDEPYSKFVIALIKNLFDLNASIYKKKSCLAINIVVSRRELVKFCNEELGLPTGNKIEYKIDIPDWVKCNTSFGIACVRGLVDTDGSIFTHRYRVGGKTYGYKKLDFTSMSPPLCESVRKILADSGVRTRFARGKSLRIDSKIAMENYFRIIGSHNPKHLNRYFN